MKTHIESSPNWREWGELRTIRIIDAVILSLGICPKWLEDTNQRNPRHPVFKEIDIEANHRAKVSIDRAGEFYRLAALTRENERLDIKVNIADYATWAVTVMKWDVPQEFAALAQVVEPHIESKATSSGSDINAWLIPNDKDPHPKYHWYTPARYFARELVRGDSTLLIKRKILAEKVSQSLFNAGIYGRNKNNKLDYATILKSFSNVALT